MGIEARTFNMDFTQKPTQDTLKYNPKYNSHNFLLGQFVLYHQDFFKTNYFFGFGRTEDIPMGYTYAASFAIRQWDTTEEIRIRPSRHRNTGFREKI